MKITKKAALLLLILVVCSGTLFANGDGEDSGSGSAAAGEISFTRWAGTQEAKDFTKLTQTFMEHYPDIKVKPEFLPWSAYWEKVRTTVISGDAADVIAMACGMSAPYVTKKVLFDVTDLPGAKELIDQMQGGSVSAVEFEGRYYGIPVGVGQRAVIYNKDLLDKAGIPYPSATKPMTWEEFGKIAEKLTIKEGEEFIQYAAYFHSLEMYEALVIQHGGALMDDYMSPTKILINTPEAIKGMSQMISQLGTIQPVYTGEWNNIYGTPDTAVGTGMVGFMHTGPWSLGALDDAGVNYGACPLPYNGKTGVRANRGYINFMAISRDSRNIDPAWEFVKWVCGEGQLEFTKTGDLPANKKAMEESKSLQARPKEIMDAFYSDLPYVFTGPMVPSDEFNSVIETYIGDMLLGLISPEEAAAMIEEEGNAVIKKVYGK